MIQENQEQELELEEIPEEEVQEEKEEITEEKPVEKPTLTLEQKRGILKRQLTKVEKELGIVEPKPKESEPPKKSEEYSLKDIRALNDVHDEDVDKLVNYAKFMGITVAEAKKLPEMASFIKDAEEKRKTANATNVGGGKRGTSKVTGEEINERAMGGDVPESEEDMKKMIEARFTPKERT